MPSLGWDAVNPDMEDRDRQRMLFIDGHRRPVLARMDNRSPFPARFMAGTHRDQLGRPRTFHYRLISLY
jgi:E3 ubiquitin-protein ligase HUWE1